MLTDEQRKEDIRILKECLQKAKETDLVDLGYVYVLPSGVERIERIIASEQAWKKEVESLKGELASARQIEEQKAERILALQRVIEKRNDKLNQAIEVLKTTKEKVRQLHRYSTNSKAVLFPDEKGEFVEVGSVLSLLNAVLSSLSQGTEETSSE